MGPVPISVTTQVSSTKLEVLDPDITAELLWIDTGGAQHAIGSGDNCGVPAIVAVVWNREGGPGSRRWLGNGQVPERHVEVRSLMVMICDVWRVVEAIGKTDRPVEVALGHGLDLPPFIGAGVTDETVKGFDDQRDTGRTTAVERQNRLGSPADGRDRPAIGNRERDAVGDRVRSRAGEPRSDLGRGCR